MTPLFKKLNYKGQPIILAINPPDSFNNELEIMSASAETLTEENQLQEIDFVIIFVIKKDEINKITDRIVPKLNGDAVMWFAYPKGSSKKYSCDFNRDTGWEILGKYDLEPVRQVAIDEDWSALRFRKVEYIKKLNRKEGSALSEKGKKRTKGNSAK